MVWCINRECVFHDWLHEARVYGEWMSMGMKLGCVFSGWLYKAVKYVQRLGVLKSQSVCLIAGYMKLDCVFDSGYMKLDCVFNSWVHDARSVFNGWVYEARCVFNSWVYEASAR